MFNTSAKRLLCAAASFGGMETGCEHRLLAKKNANANDNADKDFNDHIAKYGESYNTEEEFRFRKAVFKNNNDKIKNENAKGNKFTLADNQFSTWTDEEFNNLLGLAEEEYEDMDDSRMLQGNSGKDKDSLERRRKKTCGTRRTPPCPEPEPTPEPEPSPEPTPVPTEDMMYQDWVAAGAVLPVKNQGGCGSCWAFGAIGAIEGDHFLKTGELVRLSEQQMVDCEPNWYGCGGGWHYAAIDYAIRNPLSKNEDYPYRATDQTCMDSSKPAHVRVTARKNVQNYSVSALKAELDNGPVGITVAAGNNYFRYYSSGILDSTNCPTRVDHVITAVGYGVEGGVEYLWALNQWGAGWGDSGYIKFAWGTDGTAGICGTMYRSYSATTGPL